MAGKQGQGAAQSERNLVQASAFARTVRDHEIAERLRQAVNDHQNGNGETAARGYQQILAADPHNSQALNNLSLLLVDHHQAIRLLRKALEGVPHYVDALINLGVRELATGDVSGARATLQRAAELAPNDTRVQQAIASSANYRSEKTNEQIHKPLYTVIIPTHRRPKLLDRALASIKAQTPEVQLEIIIVADIADIETDAVCQRWLSPGDIYVKRNGKPGPAESRNLGLRLAHGEVILFLDDDDAWHPDLLTQLSQNEALRNGRAVYFNCTITKERRTTTGPIRIRDLELNTRGMLNNKVYVKNQVHMSCFAFPARILRELWFDPHMRAYEDWDFLLSVCDRQMPIHANILGSKVYEVDDETTDRRGNSQAANDLNAIFDYIYVYRRHPVGPELQEQRAVLLASTGFPVPAPFV